MLLYTLAFFLTTLIHESTQDCADTNCNVPIPDPTRYCDSDFVIRVYVKSMKTQKNDISYSINTLETYKMPKKGISKKNKKLLLSATDGCEVVLAPKEEYILSGFVSSGAMRMKQCTSIVRNIRDVFAYQGESVNTELAAYRKNTYGVNCGKCTIQGCTDLQQPGCTKTMDNCLFPFFGYFCFLAHTVCEQDNRGECRWRPAQTECDPSFFGRTVRAPGKK